jgi:hypothetical protein
MAAMPQAFDSCDRPTLIRVKRKYDSASADVLVVETGGRIKRSRMDVVTSALAALTAEGAAGVGAGGGAAAGAGAGAPTARRVLCRRIDTVPVGDARTTAFARRLLERVARLRGGGGGGGGGGGVPLSSSSSPVPAPAGAADAVVGASRRRAADARAASRDAAHAAHRRIDNATMRDRFRLYDAAPVVPAAAAAAAAAGGVTGELHAAAAAAADEASRLGEHRPAAAAAMRVLTPVEREMDEAVWTAFMHRDLSRGLALVTRGEDANYQRVLADGTSLLMAAAALGADAAVAELLRAGARVAASDVHGATAVAHAERGGHYRLAARLAVVLDEELAAECVYDVYVVERGIDEGDEGMDGAGAGGGGGGGAPPARAAIVGGREGDGGGDADDAASEDDWFAVEPAGDRCGRARVGGTPAGMQTHQRRRRRARAAMATATRWTQRARTTPRSITPRRRTPRATRTTPTGTATARRGGGGARGTKTTTRRTRTAAAAARTRPRRGTRQKTWTHNR